MQIDVSIAMLLGSGVLLVGVGLGIGRLGSRRDRRVRRRLEELEATLVEEREERIRYESEVAKHFGQTSQLFGDLTRQYSALYAHLAEGSRALCRERLASLEAGFAAPPAAWIEASPPAPPGSSAQTEVDAGSGSPASAPAAAEGEPEVDAGAQADPGGRGGEVDADPRSSDER
ncbi:MAG: ZapG family protein [Myxococcota bacterium]